MIQRIQTLYLLSSISSCAVLLFLPMGSVLGQDEITYFLNGFSVAGDLGTFYSNYPMLVLLGITILIQAISIFDFKNRKRYDNNDVDHRGVKPEGLAIINQVIIKG